MSRILRLEDMSSQGALIVEQSEKEFIVATRADVDMGVLNFVEFTRSGSRSPETLTALAVLFAVMLEQALLDKYGRLVFPSAEGEGDLQLRRDSDKDILLRTCEKDMIRPAEICVRKDEAHPSVLGALQGLYLAMKRDQGERPHPQE